MLRKFKPFRILVQRHAANNISEKHFIRYEDIEDFRFASNRALNLRKRAHIFDRVGKEEIMVRVINVLSEYPKVRNFQPFLINFL